MSVASPAGSQQQGHWHRPGSTILGSTNCCAQQQPHHTVPGAVGSVAFLGRSGSIAAAVTEAGSVMGEGGHRPVSTVSERNEGELLKTESLMRILKNAHPRPAPRNTGR